MKAILIMMLMSVSMGAYTQKKIDQSVNATGIEEIKMEFKYPELVKISVWDKNEISITGTAMINNGENDGSFQVTTERTGSTLNIISTIENLEDLPKRIIIKKDGEEYYFPTNDYNDPKVQEFLKASGGNHQYQMHGVVKEIILDIKLPRSVALDIVSKYGMVEVMGVSAPISIDAKYGGIDMSLSNTKPRNVTARTKYGELFSDLELSIDRSNSIRGEYYKWTTVVAKLNGGGPACLLTSKYGNVYLRKQ